MPDETNPMHFDHTASSDGALRLWLPVFLCLAGGAILVLLGVNMKQPEHEFWHAFLLELGLGFIVGAIISITIERYMRRLKQTEDRDNEVRMQRNVFEYLFETAVPRELVYEMYMALFKPEFIRENLEIRFSFRYPSTDEKQQAELHSDYLILKQTVCFSARNVTDTVAHDYLLDTC